MSNATKWKIVLLLKRYEYAHGLIYHGKDKAKQGQLDAYVRAGDLAGLESFLKQQAA